MAETARRMATWEDIANSPDDGRTYEVVDGQLEAFPRPLPRHARAEGRLFSRISLPFDEGEGGPGGWWILIETEVVFAENDIVVPDLGGWRRERLPSFPEERPIRVTPDWVCEVLSPSHPRRDRIVKADLYLTSRVPHYWILDLDARVLEAYANRDKGWLRLGAWSDGDKPRIEPFEAIELDVEKLFPPLPPSSGS